jgi:hypothetical protein
MTIRDIIKLHRDKYDKYDEFYHQFDNLLITEIENYIRSSLFNDIEQELENEKWGTFDLDNGLTYPRPGQRPDPYNRDIDRIMYEVIPSDTNLMYSGACASTFDEAKASAERAMQKQNKKHTFQFNNGDLKNVYNPENTEIIGLTFKVESSSGRIVEMYPNWNKTK